MSEQTENVDSKKSSQMTMGVFPIAIGRDGFAFHDLWLEVVDKDYLRLLLKTAKDIWRKHKEHLYDKDTQVTTNQTFGNELLVTRQMYVLINEKLKGTLRAHKAICLTCSKRPDSPGSLRVKTKLLVIRIYLYSIFLSALWNPHWYSYQVGGEAKVMLEKSLLPILLPKTTEDIWETLLNVSKEWTRYPCDLKEYCDVVEKLHESKAHKAISWRCKCMTCDILCRSSFSEKLIAGEPKDYFVGGTGDPEHYTVPGEILLSAEEQKSLPRVKILIGDRVHDVIDTTQL